MEIERYPSDACPIGRGVALVGDAWSLLILRDAGLGLTRYDEFRVSLGIAPNILAARLRALTQAGLLEKRRYSIRPPRDEYWLTTAGEDFQSVLQAFGAWGRRHNGHGRLSQMVDARTGAPIDPVIVDRATGNPIETLELQIVMPD